MLFDYFLQPTPTSYNHFFVFNGVLSLTALVLMVLFLTDHRYIPLSLRSDPEK